MGLALYAITLFAVWIVFAGTIEPVSAFLGGAIVVVAMVLFRRSVRGGWLPESVQPPGKRFRLRRIGYAFVFLPVFLWKVLVSGVGIARFALTPGVSFWPGIVKTTGNLPSLGSTTILANLITLTPGTLTMDYDPKSDTLYIHWMDVSEYDADDIDAQVTSGMRPWIREFSG